MHVVHSGCYQFGKQLKVFLSFPGVQEIQGFLICFYHFLLSLSQNVILLASYWNCAVSKWLNPKLILFVIGWVQIASFLYLIGWAPISIVLSLSCLQLAKHNLNFPVSYWLSPKASFPSLIGWAPIDRFLSWIGWARIASFLSLIRWAPIASFLIEPFWWMPSGGRVKLPSIIITAHYRASIIETLRNTLYAAAMMKKGLQILCFLCMTRNLLDATNGTEMAIITKKILNISHKCTTNILELVLPHVWLAQILIGVLQMRLQMTTLKYNDFFKYENS